MATSGANLSAFLPPDIWRVRWVASSWRTLAIWSGVRKCSHPDILVDGDTDAGDWSFAYLRPNGDPRTAAVTADAHFGQAPPSAEKCRAWVFVVEHVPERRIGIACGTLTAGLTVGICWDRWLRRWRIPT